MGPSGLIERRLLVAATLATAVTAVLLVLDRVLAGDGQAGWMIVNLGLAWIPLALAVVLARWLRGGVAWPLVAPLAVVWVLFLPNAPYVVTDLVHLDGAGRAALALDGLALGALALTGLLLFGAIVVRVESAVRARGGPRVARWVVPACVWLASLGIYLGRVLRWNSWEPITDPLGLVASLPRDLDHAGAWVTALVVVGSLGVFLELADRSLRRAAGASR